MIPPQPVQVQCPQCRQPFVAHIRSIVDVGAESHTKDLLLRGRLNVVNCPNCGFRGMLTSPILYHDPSRELALAFVPFELNLKRDDQERLIGKMTNALINSLPAEQRKAYLFQPRTFFTLQSLVEAVLEADGISKEMLDTQRKQVDLVNQLLDLSSDDARLKALVEGRKAELTYEFFLILGAMVEETLQDGDEVTSQRLVKLRHRLLDLVGQPAGAPPAPLPESAGYADLIQTLLKTDDQALRGLVAVNRPRFDYIFFQALTDQIDAARSAGQADKARQLTTLRARMLELTDEIDRETRQVLEKAARLLQAILQSPNPQQTIQERLNEIDEAFLLVLTANIEQAQAEGRTDIAQALEGLYGYVLSRLEAQMPAEVQLVNRLLRTSSPDVRAGILKAESATVSQPAFTSLVETLAADAENQGETELASRLWQIAEEVNASQA
jgi:hypothetical protein